MFNSFTSTLFSITIAILAITFTSYLITFNKVLDRSITEANKYISNEYIIEYLLKIINENKDEGITKLYPFIKNIEDEYIHIELEDISSKINLNFIDFTLFKEPSFKRLLKDQYTWKSLDEFRNKIGFINNIDAYKLFFKDTIDFKNIFTTYSLININNSSDIMLENLYLQLSENSSKASSLKVLVDQKREERVFFDEKNFDNFLHSYDKDIISNLSIIPSWNINRLDETLLKALLDNYKINSTSILSIRDNREIKQKEIVSLLKINQSNKTLLTYLGVKTTFWLIMVIDDENNIKTNLIMGFDENNDNYKVISISTVLI